MKAWGKKLGVKDEAKSHVKFGADPNGKFTRALGLCLTHPGPLAVLGTVRCKRSAVYVVDGVVRAVAVSEGPNDPAGDNDPSATCVDAMLNLIAYA